jgi:hypothetical protein
MDSKMKMIAGIALVLGVLSMVFLAAPIQAYVNGPEDGDSLQTQNQDRLRTQDCDCTQTQHHSRQRTNEYATNRICNHTMNLEQYRHQNRERTRSPRL